MEDGARIGGGLGEADTSISTPAHNDSMSALYLNSCQKGGFGPLTFVEGLYYINRRESAFHKRRGLMNLIDLADRIGNGDSGTPSIQPAQMPDSSVSTDLRGRLTTPEEAVQFVMAGNARLTLVSQKTGTRYTYRVRKPRGARPDCPHFVSVMYGSDNEADYSFLGSIFPDGNYRHSRKSVIAEGDVRERGFLFFLSHVQAGKMPPNMEIWHEGRCCRCGRALTVPESVRDGIGPECRKHFSKQLRLV